MHRVSCLFLPGGGYPPGDVDEMIFADEEYSVSQR